jgi:hypothetical protein
MLFTNKCCHVITLVFLLPHIILKFCLKKSPEQQAGHLILLKTMSFLAANGAKSSTTTILVPCLVRWGKHCDVTLMFHEISNEMFGN